MSPTWRKGASTRQARSLTKKARPWRVRKSDSARLYKPRIASAHAAKTRTRAATGPRQMGQAVMRSVHPWQPK